jgi:soluble lytic murein transglycosylase-like protein
VVPIKENNVSLPNVSSPSNGMSAASKFKLQKAVKDFEAIFVNFMLKNMRSTVPKSEDEGGGLGGDTMQEMFDMEISKHVSQTSSFGIGQMLYKQMTGESMPNSIPATPLGGGNTRGVRAVQTRTRSAAVTRIPEKIRQYTDAIQAASNTCGLDPNLIKAVIAAESAGNARAISSKNAKGLMQLMDSTATQMGVTDVWNPQDNILGGSKYLKNLLDRFDGNVKLALASYNAGPDSVIRNGGVPPIPETQKYVSRVMNYLHIFQEQGMMTDENP